MHLSPAALDSAIRLLDQPLVLQKLETWWTGADETKRGRVEGRPAVKLRS
jgi:hypothetical protein